jgi:hypothetical protein
VPAANTSATFFGAGSTPTTQVATITASANGASQTTPVTVTPTTGPVVVGTAGYVNSTALTAHTTAPFNSAGASTLVAFVSSHPTWNGLPVSISGLTDNMGNTWTLLTGPTQWVGPSFTLMSTIYYVNAPVTSATHTVTVHLTNPAALVVHVFAVSGSDITGPPIYSAITDPGVGRSSADVLTAPIAVPSNSLLLAWTKNESPATATALDGFTLNSQSVSYLWAESQDVVTAGSYIGHFRYDSAIGWQTAVVGLKIPTAPVASGQTVTTNQNTPVNITLTAVSPRGFPLTYSVVTGPTHGGLTGLAPNLTYTPNTGYAGSDSFTFKANDGSTDSNIATVSIRVKAPNQIPVASNSSVTVATGTTGAIMLTASDADNDPLTYIIVTPPAHGQLSTGAGANRTYTPTAGYLGPDSFTFKANDGIADSNVATVSITVATSTQAPAVVSTVGYINSTPLASHTTAAFNSVGSSTLVAFVSSHPLWNGLPVSISGLTDSAGNNWNLLTGPTTWVGPTFTLMSSIYYVNAPLTSATHTLTALLTNPAPLVVHVFAVSGTDITGPPIYSAITSPGAAGSTSADVLSAPINVPANALLLAWTKNDSSSAATALDGFTLDGQSSSYLWAEYLEVLTAGSYSGHFRYDTAIGWETAVVGLKPGQ